jgi:hypothetical protein
MAGPIAGDPDWAGGTVFRDEHEIGIEAPVSAVFMGKRSTSGVLLDWNAIGD